MIHYGPGLYLRYYATYWSTQFTPKEPTVKRGRGRPKESVDKNPKQPKKQVKLPVAQLENDLQKVSGTNNNILCFCQETTQLFKSYAIPSTPKCKQLLTYSPLPLC